MATVVLRIGGVEGNPQAHKCHVVVRFLVHSALQPTQRAVHAQREGVALHSHHRLVALDECSQAVGAIGGEEFCGHG